MLKDHENIFLNNPTARLINPANYKVTLDNINKRLCTNSKLNSGEIQ